MGFPGKTGTVEPGVGVEACFIELGLETEGCVAEHRSLGEFCLPESGAAPEACGNKPSRREDGGVKIRVLLEPYVFEAGQRAKARVVELGGSGESRVVERCCALEGDVLEGRACLERGTDEAPLGSEGRSIEGDVTAKG